jgi:hypothetical protein
MPVSVDQDCVRHGEPSTAAVGDESNGAKLIPARVKDVIPDFAALSGLALVSAGASKVKRPFWQPTRPVTVTESKLGDVGVHAVGVTGMTQTAAVAEMKDVDAQALPFRPTVGETSVTAKLVP